MGAGDSVNENQRRIFGARLAFRREAKDISQRRLAKILGVCNSYLCHLEAGRREPSVALLYRIAKELGGHVGGYLP